MSSIYSNCANCGYELCYMDRGYFDECTMCGNPQHFQVETEALMPVSKQHDFVPWQDWRGEDKDQPCVVCGFSRANKHHRKEVQSKDGRRATHV